MKIKKIKKLRTDFLDLKFDLTDVPTECVEFLEDFIKYLELKSIERKCGTPDDSGQLPMPPDLILVDLN